MRNWLQRIPPMFKDVKRATVLLALIFLCSGTFMAVVSYSLMFNLAATGGGPLGIPIFATPKTTSSINEGLENEPPGNAPARLPTALPWSGNDRVTLLLLGLDYRDWAAGSEASRSDTMILLTLDPLSKTAGILSIPRDLWANIPGFEPGKINTAYYLGEAYKLPGGGPALAMETVEQTIGVPIDYYAQVDFGAFERFIDLIGGVKLDIPTDILVDPIGPKPPITIPAGRHTLTGQLALAYARTRKTSGGDFDRAARQQQVIMAIRDRILDYQLLPELISNAPAIYAELSSGINTNLPLNDAIQLALIGVTVPPGGIARGIIDEKYVTFGNSPDDLSILIPIPDKIRQLRDQIFASTSPLSPSTPGGVQERMQLEFASISVQNGSLGSDLGARTGEYLSGLGANVVTVTTAERGYSQTTVIDHTGNPYTLQFLVDLFNISPWNIYHRYDPNSVVKIELKLGNDWLNNNTLP